MIKNIIFDIDGVIRFQDGSSLVEDVLPANLKKKYKGRFKNITVKEYIDLCDSYADVRAFDRGELDYEQFLQRVWMNADEQKGIIAMNESELEVVRAVFNFRCKKACNKTIAATAKLIDNLHKDGFRLFVLSNTNPFLLDTFKGFVNENLFDGAIFSCEVGIIKPDPDIYTKAVKKWKIKPQESLFVDDQAANLVPFTRMGGYTQLFDTQNAKQSCENIYAYISKINKNK